MGRRRPQRACATSPSMPRSARGAPEHHRVAAEAEVSAAAAGATGSEAACPGDCGGTNSGGRSPTATTSSTGVAEGAEHLGDSPAGKPGPEPGRMDHHQPGTGRYQVVSSRPPLRSLGTPGLSPSVSPSLLPRIIPGGDVLAFFFCCFFWPDLLPSRLLWSLLLTPLRPFRFHPSPPSSPTLTPILHPAVTSPPN